MPYKKYLQQLLPIDIITAGYIILTGIYIFLGSNKLDRYVILFVYNLLLLAVITILIVFNYYHNTKFTRFLRYFYPLGLLIYFYPETASINNFLFEDLDPIIANIETTIFGGYPSVWFSHYFPAKWFAEIMYFGYFSFFPLIFIFCYILFKKSFENFQSTIFVICMSFYMYYILFILFPVAGPQYFLTPPFNQLTDGYFFSDIVKYIQSVGEGPTGAFPSSHVGIMTIVIILAIKYRPKLLRWIIPISVILYLSTVYIKAHYVIDVMGGVLTVPIMYWISSITYTRLTIVLKQQNFIHIIVFKRIITSIKYLYHKTRLYHH